MLWRHCRRRAIYWLLWSSLANLSLNPKLKSTGAGRYQLLSLLVGCLPQAAWPEELLLKSQDAVALQQIKERGAYLWLIVVISARQSDRCSNIWASLPGAGYGQFEHKADSLIAKFKEAGGTVREIDVWAESPRLSPLWLSASSSACHGLLIITVITPLPTKPSATKPEENWSWRTRQLLTCRCVSVMSCADAKYTKELADAKAENDALRDDVAAGRRRLHIKAVCQSVREATTASGVDNAASPDWQTPLNGIISPSERGWSLCKNNKEPRSILMSRQISCPYRWATHVIIVSNTHALQRSINA